MDRSEAICLLQRLYHDVLGRSPSEHEMAFRTDALVRGASFESQFLEFVGSQEFKNKTLVRPYFPAGHYHSPIVDPEQVRDHVLSATKKTPNRIPGVEFDAEAMAELWLKNGAAIRSANFPDTRTAERRYSYGTGPYPLGDAITLRMMLAHHRPKRIVEIGSGFSSACILDCVDDLRLEPFKLTCIEPYPDRLRSLLRAEDTVTLLVEPVQQTDLSVFAELEADDILLVDSTHVMKTGSDVNHEIFEIFPLLKPGVVIHVHDCQFPFEYPRQWVLEDNYSWNELYGLRAFLMFNARFKIHFWGSMFARTHTELIRLTKPEFLHNPGSALWILSR